ncbi:hypothetical protein TURU_099584 [Turdus rufiventris]|nr:hypothetical protein TURU_099584 [Turdus rufiventris]
MFLDSNVSSWITITGIDAIKVALIYKASLLPIFIVKQMEPDESVRYIELRSCKKVSCKYQNLLKEAIGKSDHREENGAQNFPFMDLEYHKILEELYFFRNS